MSVNVFPPIPQYKHDFPGVQTVPVEDLSFEGHVSSEELE